METTIKVAGNKFLAVERSLKRSKSNIVHSKHIKRLVDALRCLHEQHQQIERSFYVELFKAEAEEHVNRRSSLIDQIRNVYSVDIESNMGLGFDKMFQNYWLTSLKKSQVIARIIQPHDEVVLEHLIDIRIQYGNHSIFNNKVNSESNLSVVTPSVDENDSGFGREDETSKMFFQIIFEFDKDNPYFEERTLCKTYSVNCETVRTGQQTCVEGLELTDCCGCRITWRHGQDVTLSRSSQSHRRRTPRRGRTIKSKLVRRKSFFNFFKPPKLPKSSDSIRRSDALEMTWQRTILFESHLRLGQYFKEVFLPNSIKFFIAAIVNRYENDNQDCILESKSDSYLQLSNSNVQNVPNTRYKIY